MRMLVFKKGENWGKYTETSDHHHVWQNVIFKNKFPLTPLFSHIAIKTVK
jgi:hypothetical protein